MQTPKQNKAPLSVPRIGIDLLGCALPPESIFPLLVQFGKKEKNHLALTVFGPEELHLPPSYQPLTYLPVSEFITMEEDPLLSIRKKKNSSICRGIQLLKEGVLDAFISAGNTGALFASAKLSLPMLPTIDRPALLTLMPTKLAPIAVLDVGANVSVKAENLLQFAQMGIAYQKSHGIAHPKVALLNIGTEEQKGTPELRKAYALLQELNHTAPSDCPLFVGNIEGRDVFHGKLDVLITDGFTGNVFLKTAEGIGGFVVEHMQNLSAIELLPPLKNFLATLRAKLSYDQYPGAILCGVDGIVMKCHGQSTPASFFSSIKEAERLVKNSFLEKIKNQLLG